MQNKWCDCSGPSAWCSVRFQNDRDARLFAVSARDKAWFLDGTDHTWSRLVVVAADRTRPQQATGKANGFVYTAVHKQITANRAAARAFKLSLKSGTLFHEDTVTTICTALVKYSVSESSVIALVDKHVLKEVGCTSVSLVITAAREGERAASAFIASRV